MASGSSFTGFVALVDCNETTAQNIQELASIWGTIDNELAEIGARVDDAYAVLGEIDFLIVFHAPSTDVAFQADIILERHGFDVQMMEIAPTDRFSELVEDL